MWPDPSHRQAWQLVPDPERAVRTALLSLRAWSSLMSAETEVAARGGCHSTRPTRLFSRDGST